MSNSVINAASTRVISMYAMLELKSSAIGCLSRDRNFAHFRPRHDLGPFEKGENADLTFLTLSPSVHRSGIKSSGFSKYSEFRCKDMLDTPISVCEV